MKVLGYPVTWPTVCFIRPDCNQDVWAHTNGYGDFVLFDELGLPWQIHKCYELRFLYNIPARRDTWVVRQDALDEYRRIDVPEPPAARAKPPDIRRIEPQDALSRGEFLVAGYVQDYVENRAETIAKDLGMVGQQHWFGVLGLRRSQITIVTSEFESYTVFADLRNNIVQRKDMVVARLRALRVFGLPSRRAVFLCDEVLLVRGSADGLGERLSADV